MSDPLGLSIGTTNLVAARVGSPPITRRSVLPVSSQLLSGFVERVGDPVPLIAADGSAYLADDLVVEALDAMVAAAGVDPHDGSQIAVAVPAHWKGATLRALRTAMRTKPRLSPNGTPVRLVSDAVAALTALHANPGLPSSGVVALLDFGGGGTSVTLADAASGFEPMETTRLVEFSGDELDQALLARVLDEISGDVDPAGTAAVGSLSLLREECRRVKEELSEATAADVRVELPGFSSTVRVTRGDLDAIMAGPLALVLAELNESLVRNRIAWADVSAVVAVGGGARIPLVTQRLSAGAQTQFVTTQRPALDAAVGGALFAAYGADSDLQTGVARAAYSADVIADADAQTGLAPTTSTSDGPGSATFRALAWSQDDDTSGEPVPYTGGEYHDSATDRYPDEFAGDTGTTRVVGRYVEPTPVEESRSWQRLPQLIFGVAAAIALVAVGGVAIALTSGVDEAKPTPTPSTAPLIATSLPPTSVEPPPPPPVTEPPQSVVTVTAEPPPPPPEPTYEQPVVTTTTTVPTTTTTTSPTTTTTTTTTPTTTTPTTTTTTTPPMTTSYITVPFVPVPIPIQVPNQGQPALPQYQQPPQYPY